MLPVIAEDVTNILAKEAFDALPEFLDAIDILLRHPPEDIAVGSERSSDLKSIESGPFAPFTLLPATPNHPKALLKSAAPPTLNPKLV